MSSIALHGDRLSRGNRDEPGMEFLGVGVYMVPSVLGLMISVWANGDIEIDDSVLDGQGVLRPMFRCGCSISHNYLPIQSA